MVIINRGIEQENFLYNVGNNFDNLLSIDDVCNNEDFIYYCDQFSLEFLDNNNYDNNTDTNVISIHKEKKIGNDTSLNFKITHKLNDKVETIFHNMSNDDITRHINEKNFKNLFDIIFKDLLNILKNLILFLNIENEQIKNYIFYLEQQISSEQKIVAFIKVTKEMLNKNFMFDYTPTKNKYYLIESILKRSYNKVTTSVSLDNKLRMKRCLLINQLKKNNLNHKNVFDHIIENLKCTTEDDIRTICILGLNNISIDDFKDPYARLLNILILLFTINKEKKYYRTNWKGKFIQTLTLSNRYMRKFEIFTNFCRDLFDNKTSFLGYKLYIWMNSLDIGNKLRVYKALQKNPSQINLIHFLIDTVNNIKCKLLNIEYINKIEYL